MAEDVKPITEFKKRHRQGGTFRLHVIELDVEVTIEREKKSAPAPAKTSAPTTKKEG